VGIADPYVVTIAEHDGTSEGMKSGDAYEQARAYLRDRCARRERASRRRPLRAQPGRRPRRQRR
jgi:hypothetical protein